MIYRQAKNIKLSSSKNLVLDIDGEKANQLPIEINNIPKAIKVIVPKKDNE